AAKARTPRSALWELPTGGAAITSRVPRRGPCAPAGPGARRDAHVAAPSVGKLTRHRNSDKSYDDTPAKKSHLVDQDGPIPFSFFSLLVSSICCRPHRIVRPGLCPSRVLACHTQRC